MGQPKQIAIVGGGPGGLVCARILQLHGIDVAVYDADLGATVRNQGGTLDMQADKGQIALRQPWRGRKANPSAV